MTDADAFENPAQRVGRTQELVDIILKFYIASQSGAWQNRQPLRRTLAAICRFNRVFYYATVDQLWSDMDSFLPCTVLLPLCGGDSSPEVCLNSRHTLLDHILKPSDRFSTMRAPGIASPSIPQR
jgi:hypothetical protein